jgi:hypothetical protein
MSIGNTFTFFAGWLAIKSIPSYKMWDSTKVGKAYFYRSLFGTIVSVMVAVIAGLLIATIFFAK